MTSSERELLILIAKAMWWVLDSEFARDLIDPDRERRLKIQSDLTDAVARMEE
jgi:hypothetical protein